MSSSTKRNSNSSIGNITIATLRVLCTSSHIIQKKGLGDLWPHSTSTQRFHWYDSNVGVLCVSLREISAPTAANMCIQSRFDKFATKGHKIQPSTKWGIGTTLGQTRHRGFPKKLVRQTLLITVLNLFVLLRLQHPGSPPRARSRPDELLPYKNTLGVDIVYCIPQPLAVVSLRPSISLSSR